MVPDDLIRKEKLSERVLRFFDNPRLESDLSETLDEPRSDLRNITAALENCGMLYNVYGNTSGRVLQTTDSGIAMLRWLESNPVNITP